MRFAKGIFPIAAAGLAVLGISGLFAAQEHPKEHPREHPKEHPTGKEKPRVSMQELADAITAYVKKDATLKGGFFLVYDTVDKKALVLTLDKVHHDKLARVSEGNYFVCADFKATDGTVYDLDVFMKGANAKTLDTTEITVHKLNGKERYGWVEKDGVWTKKPMGGKEHPKEHPN